MSRLEPPSADQYRLLRLALAHPLPLGLLACLAAAAGIAVILQAQQLSRLVDGPFRQGWGLDQALPTLVAYLALAGLRASLTWTGDSAAASLSHKVRHGLRMNLFHRVLEAGPLHSSRQPGAEVGSTGALAHTLGETLDGIDAYYSQYLPQIALAVCVPISVLLMVLRFDPLSGLVLLLTGPLIPLFMSLIGSLAHSVTQRQWHMLRSLGAYFLDVIQGLPTLKAMGRSQDQAQTISLASDRFRRVTMEVLRLAFLSALSLELLSTLSTAVIAVEIGLRLLYGRLDFSTAFLILVLAPDYYLPFRMLGLRFHAAQSSAAAAHHVFSLLDQLTPTSSFPVGAGLVPAPGSVPESSPSELRLEHVSYSYAPGETVLQDISCTLPAGKITALIGPSGSGKSSFAALLLRFASASTGTITWGDQDLASFTPSAWRRRVSWVSQSPYLFSGSALENLRLARPQASLEEIHQAACLAQADDFLLALPQGYDTPLGERGSRLSGGQMQRIALARAILQEASLLILDEPTAHLDTASASAIFQVIRQLTPRCTVLVITHQPELAAQADQVLALDSGHLVHAAHWVHGGVNKVSPIERGGKGVSPFPEIELQEQGYVDPPDLPGSISTLRGLVNFLRPFTGQVLISALLGAATTSSSIGLVFTAAYLLSTASLQPSIADLQVAIVGVRFFGLARGVLRYLERLVSHDTTFRVLGNIRSWFYQALEPLVPARTSSLHSGDLLSSIQQDIGSLENFFVRSTAPPLSALLVAYAASLFLGAFHPVLGAGLAAVLVISGICLPVWALSAGRGYGSRLAAARRELSIALVEDLQGLPDLLVLGAASSAEQRLAKFSDALARVQEDQARLNGLQSALAQVLSQAGVAFVFILGIPLVHSGQLEGVWLGALALAALASFETIFPLPQAAQHIAADVSAARRLYAIAGAGLPIVEPVHSLPVPPAFDLRIQDLSFTYPGSSIPALYRFNLHLPAGAHAVLRGPSGSGKSTLAALLLRFWEYTQGSIYLDGVELHQYLSGEVRQRVAVVPQRPYLFNATLRENLLLACPQASPHDLAQAAETAGLLTVVQALPQGWETPLGENGARLSAGEAQRLAIARGLLQEPALLILDEATAHLDPSLAAQVIAAVSLYRQGRSTIWITHSTQGLEDLPQVNLPA